MVKDNFPVAGSLDSARDAFVVTPDDDTDLAQVPRALYVGTGGDVAVTFPSGSVTFTNVPNGTILMIRPLRVLEATTATEILGLI